LINAVAVYALFVPVKDMQPYLSRLPVVPSYQRMLAGNPMGNAVILKLVAVAAAEEERRPHP